MTTDEIVNILASQNGISPSRIEMIISIVFEKIIENLKEDGKVVISDFGSFEVSNRYINARLDEPYEAKLHSERFIIFRPDEYFLKYINT